MLPVLTKKTARDNSPDYSNEALRTIEKDFYNMLKAVELETYTESLANKLTQHLKVDVKLKAVLSSILRNERTRSNIDLDLDKLPAKQTFC